MTRAGGAETPKRGVRPVRYLVLGTLVDQTQISQNWRGDAQ